jgi:zinc protease
MKVALLPKKTKGETVIATMTLRFGNADSLKELTSAAGFLGPMLKRGTKKYSREQIQDELDRLKASVSVSSGVGQLSVSINAKRATFPEVLDLVEEMLRHPTFPAKEFELLKTSSIQSLHKSEAEPNKLAVNKLLRTLNPYPKDHVLYVPTIE